ncbi:P-loop NTPase fold protein [Flavobacterium sp. LM4]|uniref:KAP family P-loop NTPase fold protein n=1 Tax=Flavobacterium sp. LM4 TaxID=1938609 RepID=UPI000991F56E|nr:P-loop NTPase fold protein [Flavobacterium sp. LM4]OOV19813.1 hypothetical protein BXU10_09325 [Flavobacterium sp. LM4]
MSNNIHFLDDNAINKPEQDLFNFKFYAEKVQKLIQLNSSNPDPITIGIYGKWGEGKTSFLNLIENKIDHFEKKDGDKEYLKFHFNPWRYSNEDEMMFDFFDGLAKRFYVKKETNSQKIGKQLIKYSRYLKSIKISSSFGIPTKLGTKITFDPSVILETLGEDLKGEEITLEILKDKVNEDLEKVNFKVVVFIDDLDRLDKEEIYTILKLIKLNANFKNFIFIVNIDSDHVAKAIKDRYGNDIEDGYQFLDKIINIPIHLPRIEKEDLQYFFDVKLKLVIDKLPFLQDKKEETFNDISLAFSEAKYDSPREIIKILNSFFISAFTLEREANTIDIYWIEWLKIKNIKLYNCIKNYQFDNGFMPIFSNQYPTINFNDDIYEKNYPNGTRKKLIEEFKDYQWFLDRLFPSNIATVPNDNLIPHINLQDHFEKYFSYHTIRKMSNFKIEQIKDLLKENTTEGIIDIISDFINHGIEEYKIIYKMESLITSVKHKDGRNTFYLFLFDKYINSSFFKNENTIRLIESIANVLDKDNENDNDLISFELANKLDVNQLCHFTRKFDNTKAFKKELEKLIAEKAQTSFNLENLIYKNPTNAPNRMIMHYWKLADENAYEAYIKSTIVNEVNIKLLIRNFSTFWNNSYFGPLEKDNYDYLKTLVNVEFIFRKIAEFNPTLVDKINPNNYKFSEMDANTEEQNLDQFIYWYKKENDSGIKIETVKEVQI